MTILKLRERGVYTLPDGAQVVVCAGGQERQELYYLTDWRLFGGEELRSAPNAMVFKILEVSPDGLIHRFGHPTGWLLGDLQDTGRTVA